MVLIVATPKPTPGMAILVGQIRVEKAKNKKLKNKNIEKYLSGKALG
ncbi:hypothetical protein [Metaclostridioides mangenotii]|nr:hypothetical protein [Clostridioides mangenotii]